MNQMKEKRIVTKLFLSVIYIIIITILFVVSYQLFQEKKVIIPWDEVETTEEYTYMDIYKMSEKFAFNKESNIGIHFVITKEETGLWHTYLLAIDEKEYNKYKSIIDYSYNRITIEPPPIRVYGYPKITSVDMKKLAIKKITSFLPSENEVKITEENYETYLTNSYLDSTKQKKDNFSILLCISFGLLFLMIVLFFITIVDKGKTSDKKRKIKWK